MTWELLFPLAMIGGAFLWIVNKVYRWRSRDQVQRELLRRRVNRETDNIVTWSDPAA